MYFHYTGLIAPVFSPFNDDIKRSLNLSIIPKYAKFLLSKKITGILVNGTTGEGTSLTIEERKSVTEAWADAVKETKQHLMIQVGGACLNDVKELAAHAESIAADSILCLPELYFRPAEASELVDYLRQVGDCAPKTPLLYYDFPKATMVNVDMGELITLANEKVPTFVGVKTDLVRGLQARHADGGCSIFLAGDMLMLSSCAVGFDSYIMTILNFIPEPAYELLEFGKSNIDTDNARKNQEIINKAVREITRHGAWVESMKTAMSLTTPFYMGPPRAPLKRLDQDRVKDMEKGLVNLGLKINKTTVD